MNLFNFESNKEIKMKKKTIRDGESRDKKRYKKKFERKDKWEEVLNDII